MNFGEMGKEFLESKGLPPEMVEMGIGMAEKQFGIGGDTEAAPSEPQAEQSAFNVDNSTEAESNNSYGTDTGNEVEEDDNTQ